MVFDFRLGDQALFDAMRVMSERGGMLQVHCEDPILLDAGIAGALERGETAPRFHARVRPPYVEAVATARALAFARATGSPVHVVHLSSAAALDEVRRAKAAGVRRHGGNVPALPGPDRGGVRRTRPDPLRVLRHLAAAPVGRRSRRPVGRLGRRYARPRRDRPRAGPHGG